MRQNALRALICTYRDKEIAIKAAAALMASVAALHTCVPIGFVFKYNMPEPIFNRSLIRLKLQTPFYLP